MKPTLTVLRGIPGSGKSTWAREQVRKSQGKTKRVNRDDLRAMLDDSVWSKSNEAHINALRNEIITHFLSAGYNVIVDDTNCKTAHVKNLRDVLPFLSNREHVDFKVKVFDTPLDVCLERNAQRTGVARVPENVIRKFHADLHGPAGLGQESGEEFDQEFIA